MADYDVAIVNSQAFLDVDENLLREVVQRTLAEEEVSEATVSVAVVDNQTIHTLNRRYLNHDDPTDVLSFPFGPPPGEVARAEKGGRRSRGLTVDGEVILSGETAADMARDMRWSAQAEMVLYLIHGVLHLCGYDDRTDSEREVMRSREWAISRLWEFMPDDPEFLRASPAGPRPVQTGDESGAEP